MDETKGCVWMLLIFMGIPAARQYQGELSKLAQAVNYPIPSDLAA